MITALPPMIPVPEVHRLLGYPPGYAIPQRVRSLLEALVAGVPCLIEPRGCGAWFALADAGTVQLPVPGAATTVSGYALGLVTIGPRLEERTTAALNAGDATEALLLDAIGSAAVEAAADALGRVLAGTRGHEAGGPGNAGDTGEAGSAGKARGAGTAGDGEQAMGAGDDIGLPCRISPGYGGWPLAAQEAIFARLPHEAVGVRLLPSMLMAPRKSVTFALWFDPAGRVIAGRGGCSRCELDRCPRRASQERGDPA